MFNLVLFGPPGAGKGTQSARLIEKYKLVHISTGDLFRGHISSQTELGRQVSDLLANGILVPDDITIRMLEQEVEKNPDAYGFIFDGFPRTIAQAQALDSFLENHGNTINAVIALEVTQAELTQRIALRQQQTGRLDDQADKLHRRIEEYFDKTIQVLPYYEKQGKLTRVNGIGEIDQVFTQVCRAVESARNQQ